MFSIYLSNDFRSPGDISFGGYDLYRFGKASKKLSWHDLGQNTYFWSVTSL